MSTGWTKERREKMRAMMLSAEHRQKILNGRRHPLPTPSPDELLAEAVAMPAKPDHAMQTQAITTEEANPPAALELLNGADANGTNGDGEHHEKGKMRWTMEENKAVAVAMARELRKQGIRHVPEDGDRVGRRFAFDALAAAQLILEKPRRKKNGGASAMLNMVFRKLVEDALTTKADMASVPPLSKPEEAEASKTGGTASTPTAHPVPPAGFAIIPEHDPLANVPLAALLNAALGRLVDTLNTANTKTAQLEQANMVLLEEMAKISGAHEKIMQRLADHDTALGNLPAQERKILQRVAVIGCRRDVFEHIKHGAEVHGINVDFRLYEQGEEARKIDADWAIALRWRNHATSDQVRAAGIPSNRFAILDAGVTGAITQLRTWFQPGFKPATS